MKKKPKLLLRSLAFLLLLVIAVLLVQRVFRVQDSRIRQALDGFYREEKGALDAVYVGASNVYAFFEAPLAWERYGIAVYPYSVPSMPQMALKYVIAEARKTQPDALYIINVNIFNSNAVDTASIHRLADYMPLSADKYRLIGAMCDRAGISGTDRLEFYFPMIRFHSGWSDLSTKDFVNPYNGMKGAASYNTFLSSAVDVSSSFANVKKAGEIPEDIRGDIDNLLDYCAAENVKLLFVTVPQARKGNTAELALFNGVEKYLKQKGYDCLDLMHDFEATGIRMDSDYYNERHLNIHGAMKYTEYLSVYLRDHYGMTDKRGKAGYEKWDEAARLYDAVTAPYVLPFERTHEARDYGISCGKADASFAEGAVTIEWDPADGAEGYLVYRRSNAEGEGGWKLAFEVFPSGEDGGTAGERMSLKDTDVADGVTYAYTVVPVRSNGGETAYGAFDYNGASVKVVATGEDPGSEGRFEEDTQA